MTPLPHLPPTLPPTYTSLLTLLSHSSPLELDILPSNTHGTSLLHTQTPPSLGIPSSLLLTLYLHAQRIFFSPPHTSKPNYAAPATPEEEETARLHATTILLLWDPNHLPAINFRKRYLLRLKTRPPPPSNPTRLTTTTPPSPPPTNTIPSEPFPLALHHELLLLETLLTSPLPKHTKSSTLWTHRLWVLRLSSSSSSPPYSFPSVPPFSITSSPTTTPPTFEPAAALPEQKYLHELHLVLKAGERHPRNYYAWQYARDLLLQDLEMEMEGSAFDSKSDEQRKGIMTWPGKTTVIKAVQKWCLAHPRDISGWSFLLGLLGGGGGGVGWARAGGGGGRKNSSQEEDIIERVKRETREFVRKYNWKGESIEWFLKALDLARRE